MTEPWSKYFPADGEGPWLDSVAHVTHVSAGVNVFAEGRLRAGLVYDESRLNSERIQVVWVSPNHWANGYRYGTVRVDFDWKSLLQNRYTYWVEAMTRYNPTACRFLISDIDRDADSMLVRYDPATARGPWWYNPTEDQHYWNNQYTLEFMIERDLYVTEATALSFVDHHRDWCAVGNRNCPDGFPVMYGTAAARFLATLLSRNIPVAERLVSETERETGTMATAAHWLSRRLRERHAAAAQTGVISADAPEAIPLLRAVLGAFGGNRDADSASLAGFFTSADELVACYSVVLPELAGLQLHYE